MPQICIVSSLLVVVLAYLFVARWERNYINVLTPVLLFGIPAWYLLVLVYGSVFGYEESDYAYFYCYLTYASGVIATVFGYLFMPAKVIPIFLKLPRVHIPGAPFIVLSVAVLLYAQILVLFPNLITSPRAIYSLTRSGFGIQFYLSAFAVYLGLVLLLFSRRLRPLSVILFTLISLPVLFLHGSKGELLNFLLIALYFAAFVKGKRFNIRRLAVLGVFFSTTIVGLFYLGYTAEAREDLFIEIASYAEYTRNAALVIDDTTLEPQMGRLTLEGKFYVMVPRVLFPDKPKDYGAFWLAKRYFPDRFELDVGAPDFGLGLIYADFGEFAILYYALGSFLAGVIMKILVTRLRHDPDAGTFLMLLVFLDVGLIPTGAGGVPLFVYYLVANLANSISRKLPGLAPRRARVMSFPPKSPEPA
jgi:hypothetical protein